MKTTKLLAGATCLALFAVACKKDKEEARGSVEGKWKPLYELTISSAAGQSHTDTTRRYPATDLYNFKAGDTIVVTQNTNDYSKFYKVSDSKLIFSDHKNFSGDMNDTMDIDYIRASEMSISVSESATVGGVSAKIKVATVFKR